MSRKRALAGTRPRLWTRSSFSRMWSESQRNLNVLDSNPLHGTRLRNSGMVSLRCGSSVPITFKNCRMWRGISQENSAGMTLFMNLCSWDAPNKLVTHALPLLPLLRAGPGVGAPFSSIPAEAPSNVEPSREVPSSPSRTDFMGETSICFPMVTWGLVSLIGGPTTLIGDESPGGRNWQMFGETPSTAS